MRCLLRALTISAVLATLGCENMSGTADTEPSVQSNRVASSFDVAGHAPPAQGYKEVDFSFAKSLRAVGERWLADSKASRSFLCATSRQGLSLFIREDHVIRITDGATVALPEADEIQYCNFSKSGKVAVMGSVHSAFLFDCVDWKMIEKIEGIIVSAWFDENDLAFVRSLNPRGQDHPTQQELFIRGAKKSRLPSSWTLQATSSDGRHFLMSKLLQDEGLAEYAIFSQTDGELVKLLTFEAHAVNYSGYGMSLLALPNGRYLVGLGATPSRFGAIPYLVSTRTKEQLWTVEEALSGPNEKHHYLFAPAAIVGDSIYIPTTTVVSGKDAPTETYSLRRLNIEAERIKISMDASKEPAVAVSFSGQAKQGAAVIRRPTGFYALLLETKVGVIH